MATRLRKPHNHHRRILSYFIRFCNIEWRDLHFAPAQIGAVCRGGRPRPRQRFVQNRGGLELPFWLRWVCAPTLAGGSAKTLIFSADGGKYGSSRTSVHHVEKEKEMSGCEQVR